LSLIKAIKAQLGLSNTATNNFTLTAEAADGTLKLARGNAGATTQDVLTVDASGRVSLSRSSKYPYILAQSAVPVCLAPNGTVATDGVVTLGTALPTTYSGGIWLRLPAGAVSGGEAGLYWAVMSSTTQGQVYTNFADPATQFIPFIPSGTLVAATGSNAAYTQTTGAVISLVNVTVPGGAMGPTGQLESRPIWTYPNNANNKVIQHSLGGVAYAAWTNTTTSTETRLARLRNRGVMNRQVDSAYLGFAASTQVIGYRGIDTSIDQPAVLIAYIAVATDFIVLESFDYQILPS
jgi:hypothetical protein